MVIILKLLANNEASFIFREKITPFYERKDKNAKNAFTPFSYVFTKLKGGPTYGKKHKT